jgi:hypothetical protein
MTTRQELPPSSSPGAEVVAILNQRRAVMHPWCERQHRAVITSSDVITGLVPVIPMLWSAAPQHRDGGRP